MSKNIITIEELFLTIQNTPILKNITLHVEKKETVILKGVSGSGKTTLLGLIAGLEKPTSGKIEVNSYQIAKMPQQHLSKFLQENIGLIFQNFNLLEHLSVEENVSAPLFATKATRKEIQQKTAQAMKEAKIYHKKDALANTLSGGEKQRCSIARAIVHKPQIILCDEPTANLDKENTLAFIETLADLHKQGHTIIVATHDPLFEQLEFPHRVIHMQEGQITDG